MSGGVDSAVAAQLALDAGDDVVAVTLELWSDPNGDGTKSCCSPQAVTGARALAHGMGIPHVTLDLREEFKREVVDDFVAEYEAGRTPNPCVRCNGLVRFTEMLALADALGAERLATGHYARIARDADASDRDPAHARGADPAHARAADPAHAHSADPADSGPLLIAAVDEGKDQTYMLARLHPAQLERLWFPLGEMTKPEARERARAANLPVAEKPESQDLCFLAGIRRNDLLARMRAHEPKAGQLVTTDGHVVGEHDGIDRFTIGQRRGIGVAAGQPLYVVGKDPDSGRVTVGPREALLVDRVELDDAELYRHGAEIDRVKLRYRSAPVPCKLTSPPPAGRYPRIAVMLNQPFLAAAPGQVACLLAGDRVVGHGVIAQKEIANAA